MGYGDGVEDGVLAWLGALEKLAGPGVHGEEAEETEGCAGGGEQFGERRYTCTGGCDDGWCGFVEESVEARLELGRLGLDVCDEVEGVV